MSPRSPAARSGTASGHTHSDWGPQAGVLSWISMAQAQQVSWWWCPQAAVPSLGRKPRAWTLHQHDSQAPGPPNYACTPGSQVTWDLESYSTVFQMAILLEDGPCRPGALGSTPGRGFSPCVSPDDLGQAPSPILASSKTKVHPVKTQGSLQPSLPASLGCAVGQDA